jgi:hypothetical protein
MLGDLLIILFNSRIMGRPTYNFQDVSGGAFDDGRSRVSLNINAKHDTDDYITMDDVNQLRLQRFGPRQRKNVGKKNSDITSDVTVTSTPSPPAEELTNGPQHQAEPSSPLGIVEESAGTRMSWPVISITLRRVTDIILFGVLAYLSVPVVRNIMSQHQVSVKLRPR